MHAAGDELVAAVHRCHLVANEVPGAGLKVGGDVHFVRQHQRVVQALGAGDQVLRVVVLAAELKPNQVAAVVQPAVRGALVAPAGGIPGEALPRLRRHQRLVQHRLGGAGPVQTVEVRVPFPGAMGEAHVCGAKAGTLLFTEISWVPA